RGTLPLPGRAEVFLTQDLPHRRRRHDHAQTLQFANDTLIAPTRIFACEPNDQRSNITVDRWSAWASSVRPPFRQEAAVPAQQRVGRDEKRFPSYSWQRVRCRRQEPAVGRLKCRPLHLTA